MDKKEFINKAEKSMREKLNRMIHVIDYPVIEKDDVQVSEICPIDQSIVAPHNLGFNGRPANVITTLMHARATGDIATEMAMERRLKVVTGEREVPADADIKQVMNEFIPAYAQTPYEYQKLAEKHGLDAMRKAFNERQAKARAEHRKLFEEFRKQVSSAPAESVEL